MIRGLAGLKLASMFTDFQKPFRPARGLQPLPGMDTLHLSKHGQSLASSPGLNFTVSVRPSAAVQTYQSLQTVGTSTQSAPDEPSIVDRMRASMFAASGDDNYDAKLDLDSNGRINFADMKRYLAGYDTPAIRPAEPAPSQSREERMRASFFSTAGDDSFDASADLNGDGRINFADAALLHNGSATQTRPAEPTPAGMAKRMQDAFFATKGDAGFDPALDMNNDGRINFADLQALRESAADKPGPVRPTEPVLDDEDTSLSAPRDVPDQVPVNDSLVDSVRAAFFANKHDASFNARADINEDGRVDFRDLAALRERD